MFLPELISKEPLVAVCTPGRSAVVQRRGSGRLMAMIEAEELGISQKNVDEMVEEL